MGAQLPFGVTRLRLFIEVGGGFRCELTMRSGLLKVARAETAWEAERDARYAIHETGLKPYLFPGEMLEIPKVADGRTDHLNIPAIVKRDPPPGGRREMAVGGAAYVEHPPVLPPIRTSDHQPSPGRMVPHYDDPPQGQPEPYRHKPYEPEPVSRPLKREGYP